MRRLWADSGSVLPVIAGLLVTLAFAFGAVAEVAQLVAARIHANAAAEALALAAAARALGGAAGCQALAPAPPVVLMSCHDSGTDVRVVVTFLVDNPLSDSVVGESRVGYGVPTNG